MYVIGTAGHVDHGKSTLIHSITGIDPDRLKEEKERQMTIELGFAWMELPSGQEIGFVDVPGHRDFIENMLAGAGGIDAVLLIVAADEGVMPQTVEHLAILNLLAVQKGLIVITKSDLVSDKEWMELIKNDIRKLTAGTFLSNATMVEVSALSHFGLDVLVNTIDEMLRNIPAKKDSGQPRLPVDRVFSLRGFGTIVTGTLVGGAFRVGEEVVVQPAGISTRIRGLQTHKKKTEIASPGSRTAINLTNVNVDEVNRGDVVTLQGLYLPTARIDVMVEMLSNASGKIRHNDELKLFVGTNQVIAKARLIGTEEMLPGQKEFLQMELSKPISICYRDRFILRRPSPPETIAGGLILDPHPNKRHRRRDKKILAFLRALESGSDKEIIHQIIDTEGMISLSSLIKRVALSESRIRMAIDQLAGDSIIFLKSELSAVNTTPILISTSEWNRLKECIETVLTNFHRLNPLKKGISPLNLRNELRISLDCWPFLLEYAEEQNVIKLEDNKIKLPDFKIAYSAEQKRDIQEMFSRFERSPFSPPDMSELEEEFGQDLIQALIEAGEIVKTSNQVVFLKKHYEKMVTETKRMILENGSITLAQFRDFFDTSRKYALSFLEHLDNIHLTERQGDVRILKHTHQ